MLFKNIFSIHLQLMYSKHYPIFGEGCQTKNIIYLRFEAVMELAEEI